MNDSYPWLFSRTGGFDQVLLRKGEDLLHLQELDPKLWAALACPVKGLFFDEKTLQMIDVDNDGRVRVPEIIAAVNWATARVKNPDLLLHPGVDLPLAEINSESPEGAAILSSAQTMLSFLGKPDAVAITLPDVQSQQSALVAAPLNGDGVVLPGSTPDVELQKLINEILSAFPGVLDVSGKPGVNLESLEKFYAALASRDAWLALEKSDWMDVPLDYAAAYGALQSVRGKIDDYFSRCRAVRFDARAQESLSQTPAAWAAVSDHGISADCREFRDFPLAAVTAEAVLPLQFGLNPAWELEIAQFYGQVVKPVLGAKNALEFDEWERLKHKFDTYSAWRDAEAGREVTSLTPERIQQLLKDDSRAALEQVIRGDAAMQPQVAAFAAVEKLLHYRLHLKTLLNNFVNFTDFYSKDERAIFEAGTLYLDGRACDLCIEVHDVAKHATLAGLSKCLLAYCDCTRSDGAKKSVVAAFTGGDSDYLLVGRNGIFYDRLGLDWDASITKIIENPISIGQAFFLPYKRFIRFIEERAAKSATAAETSGQTLLQSATSKPFVAADPKAPATTATKPKFDVGIVAALGVAVGGITTALGMMLQAFFGLGWLMPLGFVGLVVLISGPSMFIAWLKLRQRNLGPILDASGWAVNGQVKINVPFGGKLTEVAKLPPGSRRTIGDPYAEKAMPWGKLLFLAILLAILTFGGWCAWTGKYPWLRTEPPVVIDSSAPAAS